MTIAGLARAAGEQAGTVPGLSEISLEEAREQLVSMGVTHIRTDTMRRVGRGADDGEVPGVDQLCGRCTTRFIVKPSGEAFPCHLALWLPVGNVRQQSLGEIMAGAQLAATRAALEQAFAARRQALACGPDTYCGPDQGCGPIDDGGCSP